MDTYVVVMQHFDQEIMKLISTEFFIDGKQITHKQYDDFINKATLDYAKNMGTPILHKQYMEQESENEEQCDCDDSPLTCKCCGEPMEPNNKFLEVRIEGTEDHDSDCECSPCCYKYLLEDCLNVIADPSSEMSEKISSILEMANNIKELTAESVLDEVEEELAEYEQPQPNVTYNFNLSGKDKVSKGIVRTIMDSVFSKKSGNKNNIEEKE